ncbi:PHB depolymerase family esterase [Streptomyces sp. TRM 70351]|uniref:extracellular catalytic domain type 1 short-chain-length polyhydroxyalkanoate depolymerase n=1 Tax=Streptomyces sp. TRM 70351 TaxID=3116552 RepID=UPI002E7B9BEC|nr:PHB depolymerase family esterase [Streptomyces sp. TRM 70351]MEE1929734.1 PHB depolymerase family esterase [Streptomyces sp. TRM 70351]
MRTTTLLRRAGVLLGALALALAGTSATPAAASPAAVSLAAAASPAAASLERVTGFGPNPGSLTMYRYVPDGLPAGAPVVLVLHGCTQDAPGFVSGGGWRAYADARGFALVAAQQETANNASRCFNWFQGADTARGRGEAASLRQMVAHTVDAVGADASRVYVAGFSGGGAMAASVLAAYPDVFAGGAVLAGIPHGCATSMVQAFSCMNPGTTKTAAQWGGLVRAQNPGYDGPWPTVSVWHGSADTTVAPVNARELVKQWTNARGTDASADGSATLPGGVTRTVYEDGGRTAVTDYRVTGMGHAVPVRTGTGCGTGGAYFADVICSTDHITADWGLGGTGPDEPGEPGEPGDPDEPSEPLCVTASNYAHVAAGRATVRYGSAYAAGSGDPLGLWNVFVTTSLTETGPGHWERAALCG